MAPTLTDSHTSSNGGPQRASGLRQPKSAFRFIVTLLTLLAICVAAFWSISVPRYESAGPAKDGTLDLREADFASNAYALEGKWEFYYEKLYTPGDFAAGEPEGKALITVPASWDEEGYPASGYATYRLTVLTDEPALMLRVPEIIDASIVWIDGRKVFAAGKVGKTQQGMETSVRNDFVEFAPTGGKAEIVVQVSSFMATGYGIMYGMEIGRPGILMKDAMLRRILLTFALGMVFMMGLYHLMLFFSRRREPVYLIFAVNCMLVVARLLMETNSLVQYFAPDGLDDPLSRIYLAIFGWESAALVLFTLAVFGIRFSKGKRGALIIAILSASVLPASILPFFLPIAAGMLWYLYFCFISFAIVIVLAVRSPAFRTGPNMKLFVIAMAVFIVWPVLTKIILLDIYYVPGIVSNIFLVLSQCVILSESYTEARRKAEELTSRTAFYHGMAHDLLTPLTRVSTNVQMANMRPEEAGGLLVSSQEDIMKMAGMINEALSNEYEGAVQNIKEIAASSPPQDDPQGEPRDAEADDTHNAKGANPPKAGDAP
jgi:signal transduction histidine kinase